MRFKYKWSISQKVPEILTKLINSVLIIITSSRKWAEYVNDV